jgi:hypothetical protein
VKVLVLTAEPVNAEMLRAALGDDARDAEVLVISPALNESPVAFWASDSDEAIADAQQVQEETVERFEEEEIDAAGDTGEGDPVTAIQDALATFPADRLVVFIHPGDQRKYLEGDVAGEAERRFGLPVVQSEVEAQES